MTSNTFDRLQTDTDRIWKFQRYSLICEYLARPSLPPPFMLISHIWRFTLYGLTRFTKLSWFKDTLDRHTDRTKYSRNQKIDLFVKLKDLYDCRDFC